MAGYGYTSRGGYNTYNGVEPRSDGWSKTSYAGDGCSDHVCRPVIIDAEGRKQPLIISYVPDHNTESYVTKTETIVEHVRAPMVTEYKYGSPTKVEPQKEYGFNNNKWGRPSTGVYDRPQKVEEFITQVQTETSRPTRTTPLGATAYWRQTPTSTGTNGYNDYDYNNKEWNKPSHNGATGYNEYDYADKEWNKPSGNTIRNENFNGPYRRDDTSIEPAMVTNGGWARPNRAAWTVPPSRDTPLSKPTTDIGAAVEYMKEVAKPAAVDYLKEVSRPAAVTSALPPPRFTVSVPKRETYTETIDSREAARRYANSNVSSRPFTTGETYTNTIDSREAMRRYNGTSV